jgi:hypothetical protein
MLTWKVIADRRTSSRTGVTTRFERIRSSSGRALVSKTWLSGTLPRGIALYGVAGSLPIAPCMGTTVDFI